MNQIELNKILKSIEEGRVANTYLIVGDSSSNALGGALEMVKSILKSPYSELNEYQKKQSIAKLEAYNNPDVHFIYPTNTTNEVKKAPSSTDFLEQWREMIRSNQSFSLADWYSKIGLGNKQGIINKYEAEKISKLASLKSYEGGVKIFLIWMAEKLNASASNKLLKVLEEPPNKTVFILVCEKEKALLKTIISRCQKINIYSQSADTEGFSEDHDGLFAEWVRAAFRVKSNKEAINDLVLIAEKISKKTREKQKEFFIYSSTVFRDAILYGYKVVDSSKSYAKNFSLSKFSPFVHEENIISIYEELQKGFLDIERNGNPKIIFLDVSIKLTRLLHKKKSEHV